MISFEFIIRDELGLELEEHPLLVLPYVEWGKTCDCDGHVAVHMDDTKEYEFRELLLQYDVKIIGDIRRPKVSLNQKAHQLIG